MGDIKEKYQEYLTLRGTGDPRRLRIKADLADMVSEGKGDWLLSRYKGRGYGFGKTYGDVAASLSDSDNTSKRREPSLAEATLATIELERDYRQLVEKLLPRSKAVVKIGSSSWAGNYDVRMDLNDPSDLDIEVIMEEVDPRIGEGIPGALEGLTVFKNLYEQGRADYYSHGFKMGGRPVSIHFMPRAVFEKNCSIDYEHLDHEVRNREYRAKPKSKPAVYDERYDGTGKEYVYSAQPQILEGVGMITDVPVMMIGDDGKIVMGLVMSKYFGHPPIEGDKDFFTENILKYKTSLAKRLAREGGEFANLPGRRKRMPYNLLDRLNAEQRRIINNSKKNETINS